MVTKNEVLFEEDLIVLDELVRRFKKEVKRVVTCPYNDKKYCGTRKARLKRLRLEIAETLKELEDNVTINYVEVEND